MSTERAVFARDDETKDARATILVVDDNEQNRLVAEGYLESFGYQVVLASGGQEALELFADRPIDLVLLDVQMPVLDGFETCRRLRATARGERIPIVFLTAFGDAEVHTRAIEAQADDFLMKPIQRVELLIRVRSLIRLKALQDELVACNAIVSDQRDELVRARERRRELTAMLVHDLKNPLSGAVMNGQWLLQAAQLEGDQRESLLDVLHACDSMHRLVMDLLDVDRSESGRLVPNLRDVTPGDLLEVCVRDMRARVREARHTIATSVAHDVPAIRADRELLLRTLGNIAENATKFAPPGSEIRLESLRHGEAHVRFLVRDQGPGIPSDRREQIFDPYARLDRDSDVRAHDSRGLGLAFCRLAVEAHGGRLWVEDGEPSGSVFCIELPIAPPAAP